MNTELEIFGPRHLREEVVRDKPVRKKDALFNQICLVELI